MKKITFLLLLFMSTCFMHAQVSSYSFSTGTTGVLDPMTASTQLVGSNSDDGASTVQNIGFTFNFAGTDYTQFSASANGLLRLGATAVTTAWTNTAANAALTSPAIMAYWDDVATGTNGKVHYVLTGTAPNQKLIVEWFVTIPRNTTGPAAAKFQCILEESTNTITYVYGSGMVANVGFSGSTVGIATSATLFNTVDIVNHTNTASTFIFDNLAPIAEGRTYTFTPPTCPGTTGLVTTDITTTSATITWTEPASIPASGYEYVVSSSATPPAGAGTASATNTAAITGLNSNTVYYVYVRSICGSDIGTWVSVGTFKTLCDEVTDFVQTFDSFTTTGLGILPDCWSRLGTSTGAYITTGSVVPMSPSNRLFLSVGTTTTIFAVLPPVSNLQDATHRLRFKAYSTTLNKVLNVGYFTNPADLSTFVQLQSIAMPGTAANTAQEFTFVPAALPAGIKQLVLTTPTGVFTTIYIDDVKWEFNSPCVEPSQLSATTITNSSAQLGWIAGGATTWEIQYGPANFALGSGTIIPSVTTNPYSLTGLTANTTYQYYVRGICDGPVNSSWAGPFTFKTQCDDVTEYTQNFEGFPSGINSLPDCWSRGGTSTSTYITTGSVAPMSPANRLYMFATAAGTTPTEGYAILPPVSNLQANTHRLRFKGYATILGRTLEIGYLTDPANVATFTALEAIVLPGTAASSAIEFVIIPGALPPGVKHLAIRNNGFTGSPLGSTTAYMDDFSWEAIPTCNEPSALTASNITNSSAVLGWTEANTATAWEIQYGAPGFTIGTGTTVSATSNPFTLTSLTPNTSYVYYVRAVCSVSDSSFWTGPFAFKTQCDEVTQFFENFDSPSQSTAFNGPLPDCWTKGLVGTPNLFVSTGSTLPMSPGNRLYMFVSSTATPAQQAYAILPPVSNLAAGTHRLRFKAYATAASRYLEIGYLTDISDMSTFQYLTDIQLPSTTVASTQQFIYVPPTSIPAGIKNLVILNPGFPSGTSAIYIDDVSWEQIPSCIEPSAVTLGGVLATSATLNWTAPTTAPADGYEYYLATTATNPDGTTVPTGAVGAGITTANLTGLTPSTIYYVWVRSVCSTSDKSAWTTITSFTTPCASFVPYYLQDFTTYTSNAALEALCWSRQGSGDQTTGPTGPTNTGSWASDSWLNGPGSTGAARINIWTTTVRGWLVTPIFDLNMGGYQVKYKVGATQFAGTGPITSGPSPTLGTDDFVYFMMSIDAGATWSILETYSATNTPSHLGETKVYNIPTVTTNAVKFAFFGTSGTVNEGQDLDFFIDDFEVQTIPLAAPACATNVTAAANPNCGNFATLLSWDPSSGSDGYKLTIGTTTSGNNVLDNFVLGGTSYSFVGNINTTYYFKVIPFNANGDATGCTEQSFTTAVNGCYCTSAPTSIDLSGMTNALVGTTNFPITATTAPYYFNQTATPVSLNQNMLANVQLTYNTGSWPYTTYIWVDLNDNFIFEPSELMFQGIAPAVGVLNASFTLPASAPLGAHRMRISGGDGLGNNACYSGSWAVTVDFTVNVIEEDLSTGSFDTASFQAYPNPVKDIFNFAYSNVISDLNVYNLLGQQVLAVKPNATQGQVDMSALPHGTYLVKVTSEGQTKTIKVIKN